MLDNLCQLYWERVKVLKEKQMNSTCLSIQGPPGTGKTYNSAKIIIELMKDGKKVGVTSNSHEAIKNLLSEIEKEIFNNNNVPSRAEVMEKMIPYIKEETKEGTRLNQMMRHTIGLFHGQKGSAHWKRYGSKNMCIREAD